MKQYFELGQNEKRLEWIMLFLFMLFALTIGAGVYFQMHSMDYDRLLTPLVFFTCGAFFFLYGFNGLTKGNLIQKWTPFYIYDLLKFALVRTGAAQKERVREITGKILGVCGLISATVFLSLGIWDIVKHS